MAVNTPRLSSIQQARSRRRELPRYLRLDGSRYLLGLVLILCLMSLIVLAQTGVVATKGYAIVDLETQKTLLLREQNQLQVRLAQAHALDRVQERALGIGLRPRTPDQVRYIEVPELIPSAVENDEAIER
jgi:hypothetical protein